MKISLGQKEVHVLLTGIPARTNRGYLGYCTVSLVSSNDSLILFDTGYYADRHLLLSALHDCGFSTKDITHVVLSHLHYDHCLNTPLFPDSKIIVSSHEWHYVEEVLGGEKSDPNIPEYIIHLLEDHQLVCFKDELVIDTSIRVFETPGHTPGCISLEVVDKEDVLILCGDAIKNTWEYTSEDMASCFTLPEIGSSSIKRIKERGSIFIPGHDRPFQEKDGDIYHLSGIYWEIRGDFFPQRRDAKILKVEL